MTTLVAWISYTSTGLNPTTPRAIYVVSDSRISWEPNAGQWDAGRKVFVPTEEAHVFGYSGDMVFPSQVLGQLTLAIDQRILFPEDASSETKQDIIFQSIKNSFGQRHNTSDMSFSILHAFRKSEWPETTFALWKISYIVQSKSWENIEIPIARKTEVLITLGTGASAARHHGHRWAASDVGGTSRSIFSGFCDAIKSGDDPLSGGTPQIAALYGDTWPRAIGFVRDGKLYLHGLEIMPGGVLSNIEWRDEEFQEIDPVTLRRADGTRRFARPGTL